MKIRMKSEIQGLRNGSRWPAKGEELVVSDSEGAHLCAQGYAEPVAELPMRETAVAPAAPEKRATPARSRKE